MTDWLRLSGVRCYGRHGVHPDERELGQTYVVDVALAYDLSRAGTRDDLADTIDYGVVYRIVRDVVEGEPRRLVEAVAETLAARLLAQTPASAVRVRVAKLHPPIPGARVDAASVEIERTRAKRGAAPGTRRSASTPRGTRPASSTRARSARPRRT